MECHPVGGNERRLHRFFELQKAPRIEAELLETHRDAILRRPPEVDPAPFATRIMIGKVERCRVTKPTRSQLETHQIPILNPH